MDDAIDDIGRLGMRCRLRRFETAALVDRNIDQHRTRLHMLQHLAGHKLWRTRARDEDCPDDGIGDADFGIDGIERRITGAHPAMEKLINLAQPRDRTINHGYIRT